MVIWLTGMSGAGKTTVASTIINMLKKTVPELVLVDGDVIRALYGNDLDYTEPSRHKQISRLQALAKFLSDQGQVAVVAALYSHPDLLQKNREMFEDYLEVYVKAPLELLIKRDTKGLYKGALSGETKNVVGFDIPWNEPQHPHLLLDETSGESPEAMALKVISIIPRLQLALK